MGDDVIKDFEEDDDPNSAVGDFVGDSAGRIPSVLVTWIILFLAFLQTSFHLSDTITGIMLHFFSVLFNVLGRFCHVCAGVVQRLPKSYYQMKKHFGLQQKPYRRYVVCRKCHNVNFFHDCVDKVGPRQRSKLCTYRAYPSHPHHRMRMNCGTLLLKSVELSSGKHLLYPFMTYCYLSLEYSLQLLLLRPSFYKECEEWRLRSVEQGILCDVFDGQIWKDFHDFLSQSFNYALMINVDWFQPFKHTPYSVGVIYVTVMNLPRHLRYNRQNVILVGIIPGPHEPSHDINTFLRPMVDELLTFWNGIQLNVHGFSSKKLIRCALLCAACDTPAGRKTCGFLGHSAHYGCSRCLKTFTGSVGSMDYSGFDRTSWPERTLESHRAAVAQIQSCLTKTQREKCESQTGYRYTELLRLPYFNPCRMLIVDPMHNLFLGTAKHILKSVWLDRAMLTALDFTVIQRRVNSMVTPTDIGRIPLKIQSGFSSFTADQFKNWVIYYSVVTLTDTLAGDDLECWRHFVLACRILCSKYLTAVDVQLADALLLQFCKRMERMYGKGIVTPNMHMHCHLCECVKDYGPLHGFWLFSFERFNGMLGQQPSNNRSIEVQLMDRFVRETVLSSIVTPEEFKDEFCSVFSSGPQITGTVSDTMSNWILPPSLLTHYHITNLLVNWTIESSDMHVVLPSHCSKAVFNNTQVEDLKILYSNMYSVSPCTLEISSAFLKYKSIVMRGKHLGSARTMSSVSSIVMASWTPCLFTIGSSSRQLTAACQHEDRPTRINYFAKHSVLVDGTQKTHLLFSASWFKRHPNKNSLGKPVTLWEYDLFEAGNCSVIPVRLIRSRTVTLVESIDTYGGSVMLVCPCIDF